MAILKIVAPKGTNTFDFSGIESYPRDANYEYISFGFNIKMNSGHGTVRIYINGKYGGFVYAESHQYNQRFLETHYTYFDSDLSNAVITTDTGVSITEAYIIRDYYVASITDVLTYTDSHFINAPSRLRFKGDKYCTGLSMSFDGTGKTFDMQVVPGTLVVDRVKNESSGELVLPAGALVAGKNSYRRWALNHTKKEQEGTDRSTSSTAVVFPTTVKSFKFTNTKPSKDAPITCTWVASPQQAKYQIKYKPQTGTEVVLGQTTTTTESHTFPFATFPEGKITVSVRIYDGFYWSDWVSTDITTYAFKVLSLEPNRVAQNKDKAIKAEWSGVDPYTKYEFEYKCNKEIKRIRGTTANSYTFPANFFDVETVTLKARLYNGYVWSEWKTVTFFTYGQPDTPVLTILAEYAIATPTFTWTSIGQVSYRLQILKDDVVVLDSGDVYSSAKEHVFDTFLNNNVTYTARLSISNQYEYASDYATKDFKITFEELQTPHFDMFSDDKLGRVLFNVYNAEGQTNFDYCELYRREYGDNDWLRIATSLPLIATYTDYTCRSGVLYEYKARAIAVEGGYTDGGLGLKEVRLRNTMLSDTSDLDNYVVLIHNPKKSRVFKKETHVMNYNGTPKPWFEFGETRYKTIKVNFTVDEQTLDKIFDLHYSNNVLMFRDNRGKLIYGYIDGDIGVDDADFMKYTVSFNFTETNYIEGVLV